MLCNYWMWWIFVFKYHFILLSKNELALCIPFFLDVFLFFCTNDDVFNVKICYVHTYHVMYTLNSKKSLTKCIAHKVGKKMILISLVCYLQIGCSPLDFKFSKCLWAVEHLSAFFILLKHFSTFWRRCISRTMKTFNDITMKFCHVSILFFALSWHFMISSSFEIHEHLGAFNNFLILSWKKIIN